MREFFKGWKRKVGVMTLLLACALTSVWIRSILNADVFDIPGAWLPITKSQVSIVSLDGRLESRYTWSIDKNSSVLYRKNGSWSIQSPQEDSDFARNNSSEFEENWYIGMVKQFKGAFSRNSDVRITVLLIPYGAIVIPLTLLSAWLLLSKSRKPAAFPTTETA